MFKVFVSYSTQDLTNVQGLQQFLADTGVEVFVAEHSVRPGEGLSEAISAAIANCDLFIVLWSSNAMASAWVSQEVGKAHALKKRILPLVLTQGLQLPGFISGLKYIAAAADPVAANKAVRGLVLELLEKKQQVDTLAFVGVGALILWAFSQK